MTKDDTVFLPARDVMMRYRVSRVSLHRWLKSSSLQFPKPVVIMNRRYWRRADLDAFDARQPNSAAMSVASQVAAA